MLLPVAHGRFRLLTTTGLATALLMAAPGPARAHTVIDNATTSSQTLTSGENLTVTPAGSISDVENAAIVNNVTAGTIDNEGLLAVQHSSGTDIHDVALTNGGLSGGLSNTGTMTAVSSDINEVTGVSLDNATVAGTITNGGSIQTAVQGTSFTDADSYGASLTDGSAAAGLSNTANGSLSASVSVAAPGASAATGYAYGIYLDSSNITGELENAGQITAAGTGSAAGDDATVTVTGIDLSDTATIGSLTNDAGATVSASGTVSGTSGDATANVYGVLIGEYGGSLNQSAVSGNFSNQGTISASGHADSTSGAAAVSAYGIEALDGSSTGGPITNDGLIEANAYAHAGNNSADIAAGGLYFYNENTGSVTNAATGTISVTGDLAAVNNTGNASEEGIYISGAASSVNGSVLNAGLISISTTSSVVGSDSNLYEEGLYVSQSAPTSIVNASTGRIDLEAQTQDDTGTSASFLAGMIIEDIAAPGGLVNDGAIDASLNASEGTGAADATLYGMLLVVNPSIGNIDNAGSIDLSATQTAAGGTADTEVFGIAVPYSPLDSAVNNSGSIRVAATASGATGTALAAGIEVATGGDVTGGIHNTGSIAATAIGSTSEHAYGIYVDDAQVSGGITNAGTITSSTGEAIELDGLTGATPITLDGGRIVGNVTDDTPANGYSDVSVTGDFTTQGDFSVSDLTVASGRSFTMSSGNTVTLDHMSASSGGTLIFGVASDASHGTLNVTNSAVDLTGATITADVQGTGLSNGDQIRIAEGSAPIVGGPGGTKTPIADNSYLYNFEIADGTAASTPANADQLYLFVNRAPLDNAADTLNNFRAGSVLLNNLSGSSNPQIAQIENNLGSASSRQSFNNILQAILPTVDESNFVDASTLTADVFNVADSQLNGTDTGFQTGLAGGDMPKGLHVWGQGFGSHLDEGEREGVPGYNANVFGGAVGADTRDFAEDTVLGFSFAYGRSHSDSENANTTHTNVDTYQGTVYGNHYFNGNVFLTGMASFGWDSNDETRHDVGGLSGLDAAADYDAWQAASRLELGRNFGGLPTGVTLTPALTGDYLHYRAESYTESGAGGADLHMDAQNADILDLGAGVKASWLLKTPDGHAFKPDLHASYKYDVLNDDRIDATTSFTSGGGTFQTQGLNPSNSTFDIGAGLKLFSTQDWDVTASYDYTFKPDYSANSGLIRASYKF